MRPTLLGSWTFASAHGDGGGGGGEGARDNGMWAIRSRCSGQLLSAFGVVGAAGCGAALCVLCCRRPGFPVSTVVWPRGGASSEPEAETLLEPLPEQLGQPPPGLPPLLEVLCKPPRETMPELPSGPVLLGEAPAGLPPEVEQMGKLPPGPSPTWAATVLQACCCSCEHRHGRVGY
jgi:hypothetical protein